ncbi:MAG: Hsp33 family molecular chaperone HslO [Rhodospirillales bacterium]
MTAEVGVNDDLVLPFRTDAHAVRGRLVRLGGTVDAILGRHVYPEPVATLLGEALVLAASLAATLKYDGVFTLQTKGDGPVRMLVADVTTAGALRGYAQVNAERLKDSLARPGPGAVPGPGHDPVPRLLGAGYLAFTVDQGPASDRYQGIVELAGATLCDCIHHYFRQSEQLQATINLAVGRVEAGGGTSWRAGALMIQRLPEERGAEAEEEGWREAAAKVAGCTRRELLDPALPPDRLLYRLFHEDGVRAHRARRLSDSCRCSRQRVVRMLRGLPAAELEDFKIDGKLVVTCEFCNRGYGFSEDELAGLHGAPSGPAAWGRPRPSR